MPLRALVVCCAAAALLYADDGPAIAIGKVVVDGARESAIPVTAVSPGRPVTVLQFDIRYPGEAFELSVSLGGGAVSAAKSLSTYDPAPRLKRVLISGLNLNPIPDGVAAVLLLRARTGAAPGIYPLAIENQSASTASGNAFYLPGTDGSAVIPGNGVFAPTVSAIVNAASYAPGEVAPGEIVTIGGRSLLAPAGSPDTRVWFDSGPAALVYAVPDQVSAVVPGTVAGQRDTSVQVEAQGIRSAPVVMPVGTAAPGIFTLNQSGSGQGAVINQNGTLNGRDNPASPGSIISIYGTGEGSTVPIGSDPGGLRRPALPVSVSIAGQPAEVIYAGSAGGLVPGLFQVNARVPYTAAAGAAVPVTVTVGTRSSQPGVTLAIE